MDETRRPARRIAAGAVQLAYEEQGSGDAVVLISGGPMDMDQWDGLIRSLSAGLSAGPSAPGAGARRVIRFDQRGVGASDGPPEGYTIEQMAADTLALVAALVAAPCVLVGNSLGGSIALEAALQAPESVRGLVLAATSAGPAGPAMPAQTQTTMFRGSALPVAEAAAVLQEVIFASDYPRQHPESLERAIAKRAASTAPLIATLGPLQSAAAYNPLPRLESLRMPVLILHGEADRMVPVGNATLLGEHIAGSRVVTVPGAGHGLVLEAAEAVNAALEEFLAGV